MSEIVVAVLQWLLVFGMTIITIYLGERLFDIAPKWLRYEVGLIAGVVTIGVTLLVTKVFLN